MAVGQANIGQAGCIFKITNQGIQLGHDLFDSSPFRVNMLGQVDASNIHITGGSISVDTDLYVGNNVYIGSLINTDKKIYMNQLANIFTLGDNIGMTAPGNVQIQAGHNIDLLCNAVTVNGQPMASEAVFG
jgi:hypothetical protein